MAIMTPQIDTRVSSPMPNSTPAEATLMAFLQGSKQAQEAATGREHLKLADLLQGKSKDTDLARAIQASQDPRTPEGASIASGSAHIGPDLTAKNALNSTNHESAARSKAIQSYTSETKELQDKLSAAKELSDSLNSSAPNTRAKVVQAYMGLQGFKRFNTPEAYALADPSVKEIIAQKMVKVGMDPSQIFSNGAINDQQRKMFAKDALDAVGSFKDADQAAKQRAVQGYMGQTYANPEGAKALDSNLGGGYDARINDVTTKLQKHLPQQGPEGAAPAQAGGLVGLLKGVLGGGQAPQPQAAPAPQAPPSFEQWRAMKKQQRGGQ